MKQPRTTHLLFAAAVSMLPGAAVWGSVTIDLRAFSINGSTAAITNPKQVLVAPGDTIVFRVFADLTGHKDAQFQCLQSLTGPFLSTGSVLGDLAIPASGITKPFNFTASTPGQQSDLDGDGDLDIGSNNPADPAGFFAVRSWILMGPRSIEYTGESAFPADAQPTAIPHGTAYRIVSTLRMIIRGTSGGSSSTLVNFRARQSPIGGFWEEDANEINTCLYDDTFWRYYVGGSSVMDTSNVQGSGVILIVPEPTSLGLSALAGLGLLTGRRHRTGVVMPLSSDSSA